MLQTELLMKKAVVAQWTPPDQPLRDATPYGYGKDDSIAIQPKMPQLRINKLLSTER
jgi:hypothetical protein